MRWGNKVRFRTVRERHQSKIQSHKAARHQNGHRAALLWMSQWGGLPSQVATGDACCTSQCWSFHVWFDLRCVFLLRTWHEEGLCSLKVSLSRPPSGTKEYVSGTAQARLGALLARSRRVANYNLYQKPSPSLEDGWLLDVVSCHAGCLVVSGISSSACWCWLSSWTSRRPGAFLMLQCHLPTRHPWTNTAVQLLNKMKPTNPNADTYVEKQGFNTYLSQFPANPLVEHPDLTHWGDSLVGHPCLTLLRYALVRHSCLTLWFDTLVGHSCLTLF